MLNGVSDSANKSKVSFNGDSRRPESCGQFTYISFYARVFIYGRMLYFFSNGYYFHAKRNYTFCIVRLWVGWRISCIFRAV
jgi:hypothetical protein